MGGTERGASGNEKEQITFCLASEFCLVPFFFLSLNVIVLIAWLAVAEEEIDQVP